MAAAATSDHPHLASASASNSSPEQPTQVEAQAQQAQPATEASTSTSTTTDSIATDQQLPSIPPPVFSNPSSPRPASIASPRERERQTDVTSPASPSSPTTRPSRGASTSSSIGSGSFSPSGLFNRSLSAKRPRRQSTQDRLNEILETARNRAENFTAAASSPNATNTTSSNNNTTRRATFRMEPLLRNQSAPGTFAGIAEQYESEQSADETTGINRRRENQPNYQSTAAAGLGTAATTSTYGSVSTPASASRSSSGPRARKTANNDQNRDRDRDQAAAASRGGSRGGSRAASIRSNRNTGGGGGGGAPATPVSSRWKDFWAGFQSIELENKGSVARDHLALERTFLAWLRTSLAFASIGIAVTQLFRLNTTTDGSDSDDSRFDSLRHVGRPLGTTFLGISVLVLFLGYHRYYQSQQWILKGKFPASRGTILVVSLVAFALMVTSLVVVVVVQPS